MIVKFFIDIIPIVSLVHLTYYCKIFYGKKSSGIFLSNVLLPLKPSSFFDDKGQSGYRQRKASGLLLASLRDVAVSAKMSVMILCDIFDPEWMLRFKMASLNFEMLIRSSAHDCTMPSLRTVLPQKEHGEPTRNLRFKENLKSYLQFCS